MKVIVYLFSVAFLAVCLVAQLPPALWPANFQSYTVALSNSGRASVSDDGTRIAFDQLATSGAQNGYYELWVMNSDTTGQTCLTCTGAPGIGVLPNLNYGNPHWAPSGNFVVFQAQAPVSRGSARADLASFPGSGWNNDLWATDTHGNFWQLTNQGTYPGGGGVIYPTFSLLGAATTYLAWGQRLTANCPGSPGSFYGKWELEIQQWTEPGGVPTLTDNISGNPFTPGDIPCYFEPHAFSQDNTTVYFMGNITSGTLPDGMDIFSFTFGTQTLANLTQTPGQWNEFPTTIPSGSNRGNRVVYMSTINTQWSGAAVGSPTFQCDLWSMNLDGTSKHRLTFFNFPGNTFYNSSGICLCDPGFNTKTGQMLIFNNKQAVHKGSSPPGEMWFANVGTISSGLYPGSGMKSGSGMQ